MTKSAKVKFIERETYSSHDSLCFVCIHVDTDCRISASAAYVYINLGWYF